MNRPRRESPTIPFAVGTAVVERVWVPSNLMGFFLHTGRLLAVMGWSVFRFGIDPDERARVGHLLKAPLPWRSRPETES